MRKKVGIVSVIISIVVYLLFSFYNLINGSQWIFDSISSIIFIIFVFSIRKWFKIRRFEFLLINIALVIHNLGAFGFYSWSFWIIEYDNVVHFVASVVAAYVIFDFIARKLHIKENQRVKSTVVDEHKVIFITIVIASVVMLGTFIELIEYGGYVFLGKGEGIFFTGVGDSGKLGVVGEHYDDTMNDILVNILGSISGVLVYYYSEYKRKPWLRY